MGIASLLDRAVEHWPQNVAVRYQDQSLSYKSLQQKVYDLAQTLMSMGLKKGDALAVYLFSNIEYVILYLACFRIGVIVMPMSFRLKTKDLAYLLDYAKPKLLVTQNELLSEITPLQHPFHLIANLMQKKPALKRDFPIVTPDDIATYFSTSGTTGLPKLVIHQHKSFMYNAEHHAALFKYSEKDITLAPLAICFNLTFGHQFMAALYSGACLELLAAFEPAQVLERIKSGEVTLVYMVAAMYSEVMKFVKEGETIHHQLRACVAGGEALPLAVHEKFKQIFGFYINEGIGMSEVLFYAINMNQGYKLGSQGKAVIGAEIKIESEEIWVKTPTLMTGYFNMPEKTKETLINGWMRTGDLGVMDDEGYLWFRGRISALMAVHGHKIAPIDIEAVFYQNPQVLEAAVFASGHRIIAYVALLPNSKLNAEALKQFVGTHLEQYKVPDQITILEQLPKGISNKIDRKQLQERASGE